LRSLLFLEQRASFSARASLPVHTGGMPRTAYAPLATTEQARVGPELQTTMQDVMFTAEGLGKLLFIVGVLFFYATLFAVTRSSLFVWAATAIGAVLLFGFVVTAYS